MISIVYQFIIELFRPNEKYNIDQHRFSRCWFGYSPPPQKRTLITCLYTKSGRIVQKFITNHCEGHSPRCTPPEYHPRRNSEAARVKWQIVGMAHGPAVGVSKDFFEKSKPEALWARLCFAGYGCIPHQESKFAGCWAGSLQAPVEALTKCQASKIAGESYMIQVLVELHTESQAFKPSGKVAPHRLWSKHMPKSQTLQNSGKGHTIPALVEFPSKSP